MIASAIRYSVSDLNRIGDDKMVQRRIQAGGRSLVCALATMSIASMQARAATETALHNFKAPPRGANPYARVIRDSAGNLYGTDGVHGTVFKIDKAGTVTLLTTLTDVGFGASGLVRDSAGNLYGMGNAGGVGPCYSSGGPGLWRGL
jgi:hypothetical protein